MLLRHHGHLRSIRGHHRYGVDSRFPESYRFLETTTSSHTQKLRPLALESKWLGRTPDALLLAGCGTSELPWSGAADQETRTAARMPGNDVVCGCAAISTWVRRLDTLYALPFVVQLM